ncbi:MAG: hypothetical protein MZU97_10955 [Bacillus subtilis]|nr:hypothetical protein [Bacillus subtilis]
MPDDQLSLAIGKEGQNVRLAHRLTGWKIDIKSLSQYEPQQAQYDNYDEQYEQEYPQEELQEGYQEEQNEEGYEQE